MHRFILCLAVGAAFFACEASHPPAAGDVASGSGSTASTFGSEHLDAGVPADAAVTLPVACEPGQTACGSACAVLGSDIANCGACGHACGPLQNCYGGICTVGCPAGTVVCSGGCVEPNADKHHCGATPGCGEDGGSAGTACGPYESCYGNQCLADGCSGNRTLCDGTCVDTTSDAKNCGSCGTKCGTGKHCSAQICCPTGQVGCNGTCVAAGSCQ